MKTFTGLLSMAIIGGGLIAALPATADTVYHRVYRQAYTVTDPFSILDEYQNNVLRAEEFRKSRDSRSFSTVDANGDGFLTRTEFYGRTDTAQNISNVSDLTVITPAAGGSTYRTVRTRETLYRDTPVYTNDMGFRNDIVYRSDPCDVTWRRNDPDCR